MQAIKPPLGQLKYQVLQEVLLIQQGNGMGILVVLMQCLMMENTLLYLNYVIIYLIKKVFLKTRKIFLFILNK